MTAILVTILKMYIYCNGGSIIIGIIGDRPRFLGQTYPFLYAKIRGLSPIIYFWSRGTPVDGKSLL